MRVQRQLFESRVARRMFGSFVVASLLPLLAFSWLATSRVGTALEQQALDRLDKLSRDYGQATLDKLVSVGETLGHEDVLEGGVRDLPGLAAVSVLAGGEERVVRGEWPGSRIGIRVAADKPTVEILPTTEGADIVVARRLDAVEVFGRVAPEFLERNDGLLDFGTGVCLFRADLPNAAPFHCSAQLSPLQRGELTNHTHSPGETERFVSSDGQEWLAARWRLFLPSRFAAAPWLVVVTQSRASALGVLTTLERAIPLLAIVTLAMSVLLTTWQLRRTLNPLQELLAGTRRIAQHDFKQAVQVDPRDEFGTLGTALNSMAKQLDHQFTALRALATLDRLILDTASLDSVLETLFARLAELIPDARYFALVIDPDEPQHGRLYRTQPGGAMTIERVTVNDELQTWFAAHAPERATTCSDLGALGLTIDPDSPAGVIFVAPMATGMLAPGALLAAKHDGSPLSADELGSLREFTARVAVAVAASEREAELFRRAHYDSLTQLPNRELLQDRLDQAVARALREEHALAVLFIDLDSFKAVNDAHGHPAGDELLRETALRLAGALRTADTVARLGGDEYAMLLPSVHGPLEAEAVAVKAMAALQEPFVIGEQQSFVSASIGIAMFPEDGKTPTELLRKADMAMYTAKAAGKGCYRFFAEEMDRLVQERHSLHNDLRNAVGAGEFSLAYQPQRSMGTGRYVAVEALLRWQHKQRGPISPVVFVPILEETGLIGAVGAWALRRALVDFADWRRAGLSLERVAVNVSARQLLDTDFVDMVAETLRTTGVEGRNLEIELTEASLVTDFRTANHALMRLRGLGVRIALDDFGTGYSSLSYLNELVFDVLKIDRAFVVNLPAPKAVAIVKAVIAVADALDKEVVAEGIETESHWSHLVAMGCDHGQGYLLSKPLPRDALAEFIRQQEALIPAPLASPIRRSADVGQAG